MTNPEALDWYKFAKMDMQSAKTLDEHSRPKPLEVICYLSEQCVEKMLKGFLVANSHNPPKTHDLPMLCDMCIDIDERFYELSEISEFLNLFGVQPRYPNEIVIINEDANRALGYIQCVVDFFDRYEFMKKHLEIIIAPLNIDSCLDLIINAHREIYKIAFSNDITNKYLEKELDRMRDNYSIDKNSVIGAVAVNEIVGFAELETQNHTDDSLLGWIHNYFVLPQFRRHGVGLQLVKYSVEYFSTLGLAKFYLRISENNFAALAFCSCDGFSRVPEGDIIGPCGVKELLMKFEIGR